MTKLERLEENAPTADDVEELYLLRQQRHVLADHQIDVRRRNRRETTGGLKSQTQSEAGN